MNTYLYTIDGDIHVGALQHYADALMNAHYSGDDVGPAHVVHEVDGRLRSRPVAVDVSSHTVDDWLYVSMSYEADTAFYKVDLRA